MFTANYFSVKSKASGPDFGKAKAFITHSFEERYKTYVRYVVEHAKLDGLWLEFGVATGMTTEKFVEYMPAKNKPLHGFDSFKGLPENWAAHQKGAFSTNGVVPNIPGATIHIGMFDETLPGFMLEHKDETISVLIVDCDLYSSTKTILDNCKNNIVPGTVILFDELHSGDGIYHDWEKHEYKAFMELVQEKNIKFEWIAYAANCEQAACIITSIDR